MKLIPLTNSPLFAHVDNVDYDWLMLWKWQLSESGHAYSSIEGETVLMHRKVMETPKGMDTDHRDTNKLNNQRHNLRHATRSQNMANLPAREGSSKFKGVWWHKKGSKWCAGIRVNYKNIHLGLFTCEIAAARAYNAAAIEHFGEFARLNIIP